LSTLITVIFSATYFLHSLKDFNMEHNISLADQLAEFKAGFKQRVAPERVRMMEVATANLKASGIEQSALKVGAAAPDLTLPDALGKPVRLADLWQRGPVILAFYRGGWCPYCNLELKAWQQQLPALEALGARLVAVSPQSPDNSLSTAEKNALQFAVLSDSTLEAAEAFGVAFTLPPELVELYGRVGNDLPTINGNGKWVLPMPATFVIDRNGHIAYAHVEADYRQRAEPAHVVERVKAVFRCY
jgi:peroxiredoxin